MRRHCAHYDVTVMTFDIFSEPSSIRIVTADVSGLNWYHDLDVTNEDEITFATEVPKHFGCEVSPSRTN